MEIVYPPTGTTGVCGPPSTPFCGMLAVTIAIITESGTPAALRSPSVLGDVSKSHREVWIFATMTSPLNPALPMDSISLLVRAAAGAGATVASLRVCWLGADATRHATSRTKGIVERRRIDSPYTVQLRRKDGSAQGSDEQLEPQP